MTDYVFPLPKGANKNAPSQTYHTAGGTDLLASIGTPIYSVVNGTVTVSGWDDFGGNSVEIHGDDGRDYYYAHMRDVPLVSEGTEVSYGRQIGVVGQTGNASSLPESQAHLHIGIGYGIALGTGPAGGVGIAYDAQSFLQSLIDANAYVGQDTQLAPAQGEPVYSGQTVTEWITEVARYDCINVDDALRAADSEGGRSEWQRVGDHGQSFGPYQLFYGGGLGNQFTAETGIRPGDTSFGPESVRWALAWIKANGWYVPGPDGPCTGNGFHGPCRAGFARYQGIGDCGTTSTVASSAGDKLMATPGAINSSINTSIGAVGALIGKLLGTQKVDVQKVGLDVILLLIALGLILAGIWGIANQGGSLSVITRAATVAA